MYMRMLAPSPGRRPPFKAVLRCKYFDQPFVQAVGFLDSIALKDDREKHAYFSTLTPLLKDFPAEACK